MRTLLFCLTLVFMISCEQLEYENPEMASGYAVCGASNPLQELDWLKAKIEEATSSPESDYCQVYSVTQGVYQGEAVFIPVLSGALCCTCGNMVYNCEGEVMFSCNQEEEAKIKDKKVIWER